MTGGPLDTHRIVNPLLGTDLLAMYCEAADLVVTPPAPDYADGRALIGDRVEID